MAMILRVLKHYLPLAAAITGVCGLIYLSAQQVLRMNANDPQVQVAEDAAARLADGDSPPAVIPAGQVDLARSLGLYVIVFDAQEKPLGSNAVLHGEIPPMPAGLLAYARQHGEDRVTYQPEPGVRSALVIVPVSGGAGGFVAAGRSLGEVEKRVDNLGLIVTAGWLATELAALVLAGLFELFFLRRPASS